MQEFYDMLVPLQNESDTMIAVAVTVGCCKEGLGDSQIIGMIDGYSAEDYKKAVGILEAGKESDPQYTPTWERAIGLLRRVLTEL